eukprot:TRINITY_DN5254_c0_g1_i1.p1 TRINITY_DN5254_c0_g1~~TRINITY_DN5254_c0_g1_i1.p1  ORF type:complete len:134 (-),score=37.99 TRINITY_DN5254_c0_g1_i1:314-715(-)
MALLRSPVFIGLIVVMFLGIAVYCRLWAIDSTFSLEDRDLIRKEFDLANKEAMDESAEWRLKYDEEVERATHCLKELIQDKEALEQKMDEAVSINNKLAMLQKENVNLLERVESLTQELETEKLKCSRRETQI